MEAKSFENLDIILDFLNNSPQLAYFCHVKDQDSSVRYISPQLKSKFGIAGDRLFLKDLFPLNLSHQIAREHARVLATQMPLERTISVWVEQQLEPYRLEVQPYYIQDELVGLMVFLNRICETECVLPNELVHSLQAISSMPPHDLPNEINIHCGVIRNFLQTIEKNSNSTKETIREKSAPLRNSDKTEKSSSSSTGRILVIDDEAPIRQILDKLLTKEGYTVECASDGFAALDIFQQNPKSYDLVLLDMKMPGLSGRQTLAKIQRFRPNIPVIVLSGYEDSKEVAAMFESGIQNYLTKPVPKDILLKSISETIG